ncbi:MAG: hypothetical protein ACHQAY_12575 [Hyphomicrobiales bacterium]
MFTSERGLGLAGLALAVASGSFAGYMISDTDRQPRFSGAEYLTVFAKLTPTGRGAATSTPQGRPSDRATEADDLATASLPRNVLPGADDGALTPAATPIGQPVSAPDATAALKGYVLRSVFRGAALIESRDGLREVKPGAILPNVGLVTSIEQRDGAWVVVTSKGIITEARR